VTVTVNQAGICTIHATQSGNNAFSVAPSVWQSFKANQETQTITFAGISAQTLATGMITVNPAASSGLPVTLTSGNVSVCTVSGTASPYTVNLLAVGNCSLMATQPGTSDISATVVERYFAVKAD
jgi:hypothetical protein